MPEAVTEEAISRAATQAADAARLAREAAWRAKDCEANLLRLELGRLIQAHRQIARIGFETEYCYDDEGGTFLAVTLSAFDENDRDLGGDPELYDELMEFNYELEVCDRVAPNGDARAGSITREQILEAIDQISSPAS